MFTHTQTIEQRFWSKVQVPEGDLDDPHDLEGGE